MATGYTYVRRYKRGAFWNDGAPRMCVRCQIEKNHGDRRRAHQATVVALSNGTLPVGYCEVVDGHCPDELKEG